MHTPTPSARRVRRRRRHRQARAAAALALLTGLTVAAAVAPPRAARAQQYRWIGRLNSDDWTAVGFLPGLGFFSQWDNVSAGTANDLPVSGANTSLLFDGSTRPANVNTFEGGLTLGRLTFGATATAHTLGGNPLSFVANGATQPALIQNSAAAQTLSLAVGIADGATLSVGGTGAGTLHLNGVVSGGGRLRIAHAGEVRLGATASHINTHTGGIEIAQGTLRLTGQGQLGAGDVTLSGGTLFSTSVLQLTSTDRIFTVTGTGSAIDNASAVNLAGRLTGGGALTKRGDGILALSNTASDYSGDLTIVDGQVSLTGAAAASALGRATVVLNRAGGLTLGGASAAALGGLAGTQDLALGAATLTVGANNRNTEYGGQLSGTGSLVKTGTGTLALSKSPTLTGGISINQGTVLLKDAGALPAADSSIRIASGGVLAYGAPLDLNAYRRIDFGASSGVLALGADTSNFIFNSTQLILGAHGGTRNFSGSFFDDLTFNLGGGGGDLRINGSNPFGGISTAIRVGDGGGTGGRVRIASDSTMNGGASITSGGHLVLETSGATGNGIVTVEGGGTLSVASTTAAAVRGLNGSGSVDVGSAGLRLGNGNFSGNTHAFVGTITGAGGIEKFSGTVQTLAGTSTHAGGTTVSGGRLIVGGLHSLGSGGLTLRDGGVLATLASMNLGAGRPLSLPSGTGYLDTNGFDITLASSPTGAGGLGKTGAGTLTIAPSASPAFSGGVHIQGGALAIHDDKALGGAGVGVLFGGDGGNNGPTLRFLSGGTYGTGRTITVARVFSAFLDTAGNDVTLNGNVNGDGFSRSVVKTGAGTLTLNGTTNAGFFLTWNVAQGTALFNNPAMLTGFDSVIARGAVAAAGFAIDSTFMGQFRSGGGVLALGADSGNTLFASDFRGDGNSLGAFGGERQFNGTFSRTAANQRVTLGGGGGTLAIRQQNAIGGDLRLVVGTGGTGSGIVSLDNTNDFSGGTDIGDNGTLRINAAGGGAAAGTGEMRLNATGTLTGEGTATEGQLVLNGGTLSPGRSAGQFGTLRVGSLVWSPASVIEFDLGVAGFSDQIALTGAFSSAAGATDPFTFSFAVADAVTPRTEYTLIRFAPGQTDLTASRFRATYRGTPGVGIQGQFVMNAAAGELRFQFGSFTETPEPGTLPLLALSGGAAFVVGVARRRRRLTAPQERPGHERPGLG